MLGHVEATSRPFDGCSHQIAAYNFHSSFASKHGHMGNEDSQTSCKVEFESLVPLLADLPIFGRSRIYDYDFSAAETRDL